MNSSRAIGAMALAFMLAGMTAPAQAALIEFATRAAFDAAVPGAAFEDFEEANVAAGSTGLMTGPLDASTNNAIFSSGDIIADLSITVLGANNLFVSGPGFANYVSHAISFNSPSTSSPQITIDFLGGDVNAFALDLTSNPDGNNVTVTAFSGADDLGSTVVNNVLGAGTFFGLMSTSGLITSVTLSNGNFFGVDNIAFGTVAVPEPSALALFAAGLVVVAHRRRARS